jgi:hypothetical protein
MIGGCSWRRFFHHRHNLGIEPFDGKHPLISGFSHRISAFLC